MRLSAWHKELARMMGEGLRNKEIKAKVQVSDSRLSVLRANPLMQRQIAHYKKLNEDKYKKALDVFADNAQDVAQKMVEVVTNPLTPGSVKLKGGEQILERLSLTSAVGEQKGTAEEVIFEHLLRVTKRTDTNLPASAAEVDNESAAAELEEDLQEPIDVTPVEGSGANGGAKKHAISPKLAGLLQQARGAASA